jgi:hypothetical protein
MTDEELLPFLSDFDPPEQAEGSLDPLGLYATADALGVSLAPGVRERQSHPRYLTLALVGQAIAREAPPPISPRAPPFWLAFEWLVVRCLVGELRAQKQSIEGIPGSLKVTQTLQAGLPLCAETYLKTPSVFGFHGIYRVLGIKTGLFDAAGNILTAGTDVLAAWQKDQELAGFMQGDGPGAALRKTLFRAVRSAVEQRLVADPAADLRQQVVRHLHPLKPGKGERSTLWRAISGVEGTRREFTQHLVSPAGQEAWNECHPSEAAFFRGLKDEVSGDLRTLVVTLMAYEQFARCLMDAFDEIRWRLSGCAAAASVDWLGEGRAVSAAVRDLRPLYRSAIEQLAKKDTVLGSRHERAFQWVLQADCGPAVVNGLLQHHQSIQKGKPPNGKRSWFDVFSNGRLAIRPGYRIENFEPQPTEFVHAYRTQPLWRFAEDLGQVQPLPMGEA